MYNDFDRLKADCLKCTKCGLCSTRTNVVFGVGDKNTDVMFIGEGPGENEDLQGEPFVGRGGKLLDQMLDMIGLERKDIYIANIVKCRPPKNRDPLPEEQEACELWLNEQIRLINPKLIVCLGRVAAKKYIGKDFMVTKQHGLFFDIDGRKIMGTFHPAALLRNPNQKPQACEDFFAIHDFINNNK